MIYLALGANQGNRRENLRRAIAELGQSGFRVTRVSPVVETPAMLDGNAEPDWIRPYLNCVIEGECPWSPREGLEIAKRIERGMGRTPGPRWSPRPIDIDLLIWGDLEIRDPDLRIPHIGIAERSFVLTPLLHLAPNLAVPGTGMTVFQLSRIADTDPLWMAIVNLTPDSFSGDGLGSNQDELESRLERHLAQGVQILDFGAESTRPNAAPVDPEEEWRRLEPALCLARERIGGDPIGPRISIDSRHWRTVARALELGVDCVNDVGGLGDPKMCAMVRESGCDAVAMHSVTVPVDPDRGLPKSDSALAQVKAWIERRMEYWSDQGLDPARIIIDPGIGFGKDALQSLELVGGCRQLRDHGLRLLIGHSRKSFMKGFAGSAPDRDSETLGVSLALSGTADILRVHDPDSHMRAYLAYRHVKPTG
ncbi:MAG: dihydropteroate synthase [Gammaproteobacteria bacterium]|nr:dihydropteroate synthase [Gammaproteobacteria bacterium]MYJ51316.1 dihydropteroate synthase [Gammaproteobacteria bacterium]